MTTKERTRGLHDELNLLRKPHQNLSLILLRDLMLTRVLPEKPSQTGQSIWRLCSLERNLSKYGLICPFLAPHDKPRDRRGIQDD